MDSKITITIDTDIGDEEMVPLVDEGVSEPSDDTEAEEVHCGV